MRILVRAGAWQVLLLILSPTILFSLWLFGSPSQLSEIAFQRAMIVAGLMMNLFFFLWVWSIGRQLHEQIMSPSWKQSLSLFNLAAMYVFVFMALFGLIAIFSDVALVFETIITSLSVLAIGCMVYMVTHVSRVIVACEQIVNSLSGSVFNTFLELWVFPIGIWFVQPRVNQLLGKKAQ